MMLHEEKRSKIVVLMVIMVTRAVKIIMLW